MDKLVLVKTYIRDGNSSNTNNVNYTPGLYSFAIYDFFNY